MIIGFAGPVLNPQAERSGSGPLLIVADGTWADARDWTLRTERIAALLDEAARQGRPAAMITLTDLPPQLTFQSADVVAQGLPNLQPAPWDPQPDALTEWTDTLTGSFDTFWLSDGLARGSRAALLDQFEAFGTVTVFQSPRQTLGLRPARFEDGEVKISAARTPVGTAISPTVAAIGLDPSGVERQLADTTLEFIPGEPIADVTFDLPPELRNRITRFEISGTRSAGAISLVDDALRRREVALIAGGGEAEGLELLSPLFYLREALEPTADLIDGTLCHSCCALRWRSSRARLRRHP